MDEERRAAAAAEEEEEELNVTDLLDIELLKQIQDAFADMTGYAAQIADKDGKAVIPGSNFTDFCMKYTRQSPLGKERCFECDRNGGLIALKNGRSCAYHCHAGLVDFAAPILANGKFIGSFAGGQVLTVKPDLDKFARIADELGIDKELYLDAVKKVNIVNEEDINKKSQFLYTIANILSNISYTAFKLRRLNEDLEQAVRAKSDFLANMSHEIRTPMNAVLGMAEMALREDMSPDARDYIYQIKASGKNLLVIINDILDFSKIESGKMDIVPVTYEPLSIFNDISSIICSRIGDKDIEFIMDISPDIPNRLMGDSVRIHQILINLLNNAVKFTKRGQVRLTLDFEKTDDGNIVLKGAVSDTGCGIKEEDMEKLFVSFQQVDSKRNRNIEGTGLGLPISKQLLELMGGDIRVESVYEEGTTFFFDIPQKVVTAIPMVAEKPDHKMTAALYISNIFVKRQIMRDLEKIGVEVEDAAISDAFASKENGVTSDFLIIEKAYYTEELNRYFLNADKARCIVIEDFDAKNDIVNPNVKVIRKPVYFINLYAALGIIEEFKRGTADEKEEYRFIAPEANVLIVDDNPVNLTVAKGLLDPLQMKIDTADGARATIECIKQTKYDLIFMDHMMPEVDGIETTHIIRRMFPEYETVPIIALTANALDGTREMFLKEGMNDFVAKPIDLKDITAKIHKWLPPEKIQPVMASDSAETDDGEKLEIEGLNVKNAMALLGSRKLYMTVLRDYYTAIDKKYASIKQHFDDEDWRSYTIEVHSLKSTSRQIGADALSVLAFELEMAGNNENIDRIKAKTADMLAMYLEVKALLAPLFPDVVTDAEKKDATPTQIMEMLNELSEALENFDTLLIDDVIEKMSAFRYPDHEDIFEQLSQSAEDSEIDECMSIVRLWKKEIADLYIHN